MELREKALEARQRTLGSEDTKLNPFMKALPQSLLRHNLQFIETSNNALLGKTLLVAGTPHTLSAMYNLAISYCNLERHQKAMDLMEKVLEERYC